MPVRVPGKERESLTFASENYKALVRKYLETMGYSQITDSFVEGHLPDMVFINPNISLEKYFYVECKATKLSVNNPDFAREILEYLYEWLNPYRKNKFSLFIFAEQLMKKSDYTVLFDNLNSNKIKSWVNKHIEKLPIEKQDLILKEDFENILSFFALVEINGIDIPKLTFAIEKKKKDNSLSINNQAEKLFLETQRRLMPIRSRNKLISNLVEIRPPAIFFKAKSKLKTEREIREYFDDRGITVPPIIFNEYNQQFATFCPFNDSNQLSQIIDGEPKSANFCDLELNNQIYFVNTHLRRYYFKKGMRRVPQSHTYFFEAYQNEDGTFNERICLNYTDKETRVARPLYKDGTNGEKIFNFVFHRAAEISCKYIWGSFYIEIIPSKIYTKDGVTPIEGEAKDIIDRFFRNPAYNRSPSKLSHTKFWHYHLFVSDKFERPEEDWFKLFKFGNLLSFDFEWSPETIKQDGQSLLVEFSDEEYIDN